MNAPWLFAEAYKYRRLRECFSVSKFWRDYDVFYRQKVRSYLYSVMTSFHIYIPFLSVILSPGHQMRYLSYHSGLRSLSPFLKVSQHRRSSKQNVLCSLN